jgi:hypothetical protein
MKSEQKKEREMKKVYTVMTETGDFRWVFGNFDSLEAAMECSELHCDQPYPVSIKISYVEA